MSYLIPKFRHIVGLAGPPGAGKTTIASEVAKRVNKLWPQKASAFDSQVEPPEIAVVLPMDGFHLYRHQLDSMEDPKEANARRGAPWTFDPDLFLKCLKTLKEQVILTWSRQLNWFPSRKFRGQWVKMAQVETDHSWCRSERIESYWVGP